MPLKEARQTLLMLASLGEGIPVSYALAFIEIASDEGMSITTLAQRLNTPLSTVSRIVAALTGAKYGLIIVSLDKEEKRRKVLTLSPSGKRAAAAL